MEAAPGPAVKCGWPPGVPQAAPTPGDPPSRAGGEQAASGLQERSPAGATRSSGLAGSVSAAPPLVQELGARGTADSGPRVHPEMGRRGSTRGLGQEEEGGESLLGGGRKEKLRGGVRQGWADTDGEEEEPRPGGTRTTCAGGEPALSARARVHERMSRSTGTCL